MSVYNKILVPLDDSELAERVIDTALGTAAWSGADVILLRVLPQAPSLEVGEAAVDLNVIEQEIDELLAKCADRDIAAHMPERAKIHAEVRTGNVVEAITSAVAELQIDLVIMGSHGRKGFLEMFTGSTTEQALAKVPASVFVVRPEGYPYLRD